MAYVAVGRLAGRAPLGLPPAESEVFVCLLQALLHHRHLCPYASMSTPFSAIQHLESKGDRDTLFRC